MDIDEAPHLAGSRTKRALVTLITENGFEIVRLGDLKNSRARETGRHCFVVRAPNGDERDVTVEFTHGAIALIQRKGNIPLSRGSSFWIDAAERSLGTYLWQRTEFPPSEKLVIDEACFNELAVAERCDSDSIPDQQENESRYKRSERVLGRKLYFQSLITALSLYLIVALAPRIITPEAHLRDVISVLTLYTPIFVGGTLVGLTIIHFASLARVHRITAASAANGPDRITPISYDEEGRTPVERVIRSD